MENCNYDPVKLAKCFVLKVCLQYKQNHDVHLYLEKSNNFKTLSYICSKLGLKYIQSIALIIQGNNKQYLVCRENWVNQMPKNHGHVDILIIEAGRML